MMRVASCSATTSTMDQAMLMEEGQKTVEMTTAELRQVLADSTAYVFDARSYLEYAISHIPGSLTVALKAEEAGGQAVSPVLTIAHIVQTKQAAIVLYSNGPFCEQSKRLADDLLDAGFTNVRRYQLGIPTWRALVGVTQIELAGASYVFANDKTAVWIDTRSPAEYATGTVAGAINVIDKVDFTRAKVEKRLPMRDHNTRMIVFGKDGAQAHAVAALLVKSAFHNVNYFDGAVEELLDFIDGGNTMHHNQSEWHHNNGYHMAGDAYLTDQGQLRVDITTWTSSWGLGFTGGCIIPIIDGGENVIYKWQIWPLGVDARMVWWKRSRRTDHLEEQIDPALVAQAARIELWFGHMPKERWDEVMQDGRQKFEDLKQFYLEILGVIG